MNEKVLVIDHDKNRLTSLTTLLKDKKSYSIKTAVSWDDALKALPHTAEDFDLIITNIGDEETCYSTWVLEELRNRGVKKNVLVLYDSTAEQNMIKALEDDLLVHSMVMRTGDYTELEERIEKAIRDPPFIEVGIVGLGDIAHAFLMKSLINQRAMFYISSRDEEKVKEVLKTFDVNIKNKEGRIKHVSDKIEIYKTSDIVFMCADANKEQTPDRAHLLYENARLFYGLRENKKENIGFGEDFRYVKGLLVVLTNEPEPLSMIARILGDLPRYKVVGMNECDPARLEKVLRDWLEEKKIAEKIRKEFGVSDLDIKGCHVGGLHSNPVIHFSTVRINSKSFKELKEIGLLTKEQEYALKDEAYQRLKSFSYEVYETGEKTRDDTTDAMGRILSAYRNEKQLVTLSFPYNDDPLGIPIAQLCSIEKGVVIPKRVQYSELEALNVTVRQVEVINKLRDIYRKYGKIFEKIKEHTSSQPPTTT